MDFYYSVGDEVVFLGVGRGRVVGCEIWPSGPHYRVLFAKVNPDVPHLCHEMELVRADTYSQVELRRLLKQVRR